MLNNQIINSDMYYRQLDELDAAVKQKRPELVNKDNARPYTSLVTHQKLLQLE